MNMNHGMTVVFVALQDLYILELVGNAFSGSLPQQLEQLSKIQRLSVVRRFQGFHVQFQQVISLSALNEF